MTIQEIILLVLRASIVMTIFAVALDAKPGEGMCSKPGGKKPKKGAGQQLADIITEQQQLGESMKKMPSPGGKKPGGEKPGDMPVYVRPRMILVL